jgi:hemoglobin-like flavoprotein
MMQARNEELKKGPQLDQLKKSLETLMADERALTDRVYADFFGEHPNARGLFGTHSQASQAQMVRETLMYALDHMDEAPWVKSNLEALGDKHHGYEVSGEMYGWFVESLIRVFGEFCGDDWTPELEEDWRRVLQHLSSLMRLAGHGAPA